MQLYRFKENKRTCLSVKYFLLLSMLSMPFSRITAAIITPAPRQKININREWKFTLGDQKGAEQSIYPDKNWDDISLPHSFSTPYFGMGQWYVGYGWYRKYFNVPANWKGKHLFIEFEGAFRDAEVFVNGKPVGHHQSGYTGFSYEITDAVVSGKNVLAVRLNNLWNAQLAPRDGDHNFCGGIYRDVYLVVTNPAHITWYGTFVTTPVLSKASGTVNVKTEVVNQSITAKAYLLKTSVIDPNGKIVDSFSSSMKIDAGTTVNFDQTGNPISSPKLWHPQHPFLYKTISRLYDGKTLVDAYETTFGFRWMEWTADKGFFLNGEHYYFHGANAHQDHAGWASAVTNGGIARDVKLLKEAGFDFIRGAHYPHDPAFSDACDSLGVMLWSENNFWAAGNFNREGSWFYRSGVYPVNPEDQKPFEENVKTSLAEMIRVHRNHPAIVTWSMGNEMFFGDATIKAKVKNLLKDLVDLSHQLDPSRKAAIGGVQRGDIDKIGDIAGYNGDGAKLFINPGIPNVVSEYGASVNLMDRPGKYFSGYGDLQHEEFAWRSGQIIWTGFDYGTQFTDGKNGRKGLLDYFRLPKRSWYWYRNEYMHIPPPEWPVEGTPAVLSLTSDKTFIKNTDGTDDVQLVVTVLDKEGKAISNCPDVTLTLESGPGQFPTGNSITFSATSDIAIRDGKAAIEFHSYYGGKSIIRATSPGLKDAVIAIQTSGLLLYIAGKTPKVKDVTYKKFYMIPPVAVKTTRQNMAWQHPTYVSGAFIGHSGSMANDQDSTTYWQATPDQKGEIWWEVDMEHNELIKEIRLHFLTPGVYHYILEVSDDNNNWKTISDQAANTATIKTQTIPAPAGLSAKFVRVLFKDNNANPALTEVEIYNTN